MRISRVLKVGTLAAAFGILALQLVPYGRSHVNPPVLSEPRWSSPQVRQLAVRACFDCHSNETEWPWYSNVAPMSWLVQRDVERGRDELNWSEWEDGEEEGEDMVETIVEGEMPPLRYELAHSRARLSKTELRELTEGLIATFPDD